MKYYKSMRDIDRRTIEKAVKDFTYNEDMEFEIPDNASQNMHPNDPSINTNDMNIENFVKELDPRFIMNHVQDELSGITEEDEVTEEDVYALVSEYIWTQVEEEYGFDPRD